MTKEEIIEELQAQMNPGSMTVDGLIELAANVTVERDEFENRMKALQESMKKVESDKSYWYDCYLKESAKVSQMVESMQTMCNVANEIVERWKR